MALSSKQKIIKFLSPLLFKVIKFYWKLFKPTTFGVMVVVECNKKFLIIRNTYGYKRLTFPGGSIDKGETPEDAARREVKEEVGIDLKDLKYLGMITNTEMGKIDNVHVFYAEILSDSTVRDEFEIAEILWFDPSEMPTLGPIATTIWTSYFVK